MKRTQCNMAVLNYLDHWRMSLGVGSTARMLKDKLGKGAFVTVKTTRVEEGDAPLREYLEKLIECGLAVGKGQEFHALIGSHYCFSEKFTSLIILRRREPSYNQREDIS